MNLVDKDDRKLFKDDGAGLKDENLLGKKENYLNFAKLMENELESKRFMECLKILTEWVAGGNIAALRVRILRKKIDILHSYLYPKDQNSAYSDLVWSQSNLGDITQFFDIFDKAPTITAELEAVQNKRNPKHIMLGNIL